MDNKIRALPHLGSYYLQKKAYQQHRKKIQYIKHSMPQSRRKLSSIIVQSQKQAQLTFDQPIRPNKYSMSTIKQQLINSFNRKMSPWQKRIKEQADKQNLRLYNQIKKCSSTINRKQIDMHRVKNQLLKQRMSKFLCPAGSQKTLLKCKHSLEMIRQREKKIQSNKQSRYASASRNNRPTFSKIQRQSFNQQNRSECNFHFKDRRQFSRIQFIRQSTKIRSHFEDTQHNTKAKQKLQALRASEQRKMRRAHTEISKSYKKDICFSTEVETEII